jgi:hypothetical protein
MNRYGAISSHLRNVHIALQILTHPLPSCYITSQTTIIMGEKVYCTYKICLRLQVLSDPFSWTYDICFICVYKLHLTRF